VSGYDDVGFAIAVLLIGGVVLCITVVLEYLCGRDR
jgi:hypothetical protein